MRDRRSLSSKRLTVLVLVANGGQPSGHAKCIAQEACNSIVDQRTNIRVGQSFDSIYFSITTKDAGNLAMTIRVRRCCELEDCEEKN